MAWCHEVHMTLSVATQVQTSLTGCVIRAEWFRQIHIDDKNIYWKLLCTGFAIQF